MAMAYYLYGIIGWTRLFTLPENPEYSQKPELRKVYTVEVCIAR